MVRFLQRLASTPGRLIRRLHSGERGSVIVIVAGAMFMLTGFAALAVDVGQLFVTRGDIQNAADAAALAGAQQLHQGQPQAEAAARDWATRNDIDPADIVSVDFNKRCDGSTKNWTIRVKVKRNVDFTFARVLGFTDQDVTACAVAKLGGMAGMIGVIPLSVDKDLINYNGGSTTLKYDASNKNGANTSPLRIDGSGASTYRDSLKYGTTTEVCAKETGSFMGAGCYTVDTEPGNMTGPTREAIDYRLNNASAACDTFDEVFDLRPDGLYGIRGGCNPFLDPNSGSTRVVLIPVIADLPPNGKKDVEILRFAVFWLEELPSCSGNSCTVKGTFVKAIAEVQGRWGVPDSVRALNVARLVD